VFDLFAGDYRVYCVGFDDTILRALSCDWWVLLVVRTIIYEAVFLGSCFFVFARVLRVN
jgi:hypothetical protein